MCLWTDEKRLQLIEKIAVFSMNDTIHPRDVRNNMVAIYHLTCESSEFLERNKLNFEEFIKVN